MKNLTGYKRKSSMAAIVMLFVILMVSGSCSKSDSSNTTTTTTGGNNPGANEVFILDMAFVPNTITVAAGTTITWTNKDATAHTVTSNTALFNSGSMSTGKTFSYTFATAGTYAYHCSIHPSMVASVTAN